eukprot:TRINITY_DN1175_c0_g1_i1.p1 TRINITY_DN1175_c0_g1~~TRINITY_DN1175_c0_g1_i1.p1  ORF type:complete len:183 (+),score=6.29 TRINITY_DN1175_c0_g1_i1:28-576(+)
MGRNFFFHSHFQPLFPINSSTITSTFNSPPPHTPLCIPPSVRRIHFHRFIARIRQPGDRPHRSKRISPETILSGVMHAQGWSNSISSTLFPLSPSFHPSSSTHPPFQFFIKDLAVLGLDLSSVILIDNSPIAYSNDKDSAIPIKDWYANNLDDEALLDLLPFLNSLRFVNDVRSVLKLRNPK